MEMTEKNINGIKILHSELLDSTNKAAMAGEYAHLTAIVADRQSGGRGRLGRSFFSPDGGLYESIVLSPERILCGTGFCTAAAALAVKLSLERFGVCGLSVKWVNDLLRDGKKVCGILTEARTEGGEIERIVVGIGINLRAPDGGFPEEIRDRAGAVDFEGDKLELAAEIARVLGEYISLSPEKIAELYSQNLALIGRDATVTDYADGQKKLCGTILGVDENCFLRLQLPTGEIRTVSSGEID